MLKEFLSHKLAYLGLIIALVLFIFTFIWVWPNKEATQALILVLIGFYVMWGCFVHTKSRYLSMKIVLEYIATAALAGACLHLLIL